MVSLIGIAVIRLKGGKTPVQQRVDSGKLEILTHSFFSTFFLFWSDGTGDF